MNDTTHAAREAERAAKAKALILPAGSEERDFWLEAAVQHGFEETAGGEHVPEYDPPAYFATADEVLALMASARQQGRDDAVTPAARWRQRGEADPHGDRYDCPRERLCGGHLTDDEVAHQTAMIGRNDLDHEAKLSVAKDRIRWLSRRVVALETAAPVVIEASSAMPGKPFNWVLTVQWPNGAETVEHCSTEVAALLGYVPEEGP